MKKAIDITAHVTGEMMMGKYTGHRKRVASDEIARLAYRLYESRGRQDGHHLDDWLKAERELLGHRA